MACETRRLAQSNDKRPPTSLGTMRSMEHKSSPIHNDSGNDLVADSQISILFSTNDSRNLIKSMETLDLQFGEQLIHMYTPYVV